jgi:hypothetical protein
MKTRSLGIAFAALLAFAPVRGSAEDAASPAAPAKAATPATNRDDPPASVPRPSIVPKTVEGTAPAATETTARKPRRYARKHYRRYAYWEPFPVYWPNYYRHHLSWRRVAWFGWF